MSLAKSISQVTLLNFTNALIGFVGVIGLTRLTSQAILGGYFLFVAVVSLSSLPASAGINGAIEKRISEGKDPGCVYSTAILARTGPLLATSIVLLILGQRIERYVGSDVVILVVLGMFAQAAASQTLRTLRGEDRVPLAISLQTVRLIIFYIGGAILLVYGGGLKEIIYAFVSGYGFVILVGAVLQSTRPALPSWGMARSIFRYAKSNAITSIGGIVYQRMDIAVLGLFVTPSLIAAYEVAWRLSKVGLIVSRSVSISIFPRISARSDQGEYNRIQKTVERAFVPGFVFVIPVWIGGNLLSADLLATLYGQEYAVASLSFGILLTERVIRAGNQVVARCLHAIDRPDLSAKATVLSIVVNLLLNFLLAPIFGIVGAALATGISFSIKFLIEDRYLRTLIPVTYPWRTITWITLSAVMMGVYIQIVRNYFSLSSIPEIIALIVTGGTVFAIITVFSPPFREWRTLVVEDYI